MAGMRNIVMPAYFRGAWESDDFLAAGRAKIFIVYTLGHSSSEFVGTKPALIAVFKVHLSSLIWVNWLVLL